VPAKDGIAVSIAGRSYRLTDRKMWVSPAATMSQVCQPLTVDWSDGSRVTAETKQK
jgi:hypothetical protein